MCYELRWRFEALHPAAKSYACSVNDSDPELHGARHGNITTLSCYFLITPMLYLETRYINIWLIDKYNYERECTVLEKLKILNSFD
jgi:hypothetical protein